MIVFNNYQHGRELAASAGAAFNREVDIAISRVDKVGALMGGVVYQNYTGSSITMHVSGKGNWINRDMLWVCFDYPFTQLKCKKVFGMCPESNKEAFEFNKKVGFSKEHLVEDVFPDGGMIIMSMQRADCRWLKITPSHEQGQA